MDGDGNLAALAKYEKEVNVAELKHDTFVEAVFSWGIADGYEQLRGQYNEIAESFGYETTSFEEFIRENI